jgi:hypothetical protein
MELQRIFKEDIKVTGEQARGEGLFEIKIIGGKTLHSMKEGQGYVDTSDKIRKIADGIRDALKEIDQPKKEEAKKT